MLLKTYIYIYITYTLFAGIIRSLGSFNSASMPFFVYKNMNC